MNAMPGSDCTKTLAYGAEESSLTLPPAWSRKQLSSMFTIGPLDTALATHTFAVLGSILLSRMPKRSMRELANFFQPSTFPSKKRSCLPREAVPLPKLDWASSSSFSMSK